MLVSIIPFPSFTPIWTMNLIRLKRSLLSSAWLRSRRSPPSGSALRRYTGCCRKNCRGKPPRRTCAGRLSDQLGCKPQVRSPPGGPWLPLLPSWRCSRAAPPGLCCNPTGGGDIADAVVSGHVRALMAPQSSDVLSSDRHTVKPWFNGRIPQAPRVPDLGSQDFKLVGGRIDVVERVAVPSLLYQRRQHLISISAIPKTGVASTPTRRTIDGYNIVAWNDDDVSYWATSDLNVKELEEFATAFRGAP